MKIAATIAGARTALRRADRPVVLVPTMGALHAGHASLIQRARQTAGLNGTVVVSIFVNPIQFGPKEDLANYPRPERKDASLCRTLGVDLLFRPTPGEMYAADASVTISESTLSETLCGRSRPSHFAGVCTVVAKLFNIIQPTVAIFGEKDWQQLAIIRRMVRDLDFPIRIVGHPTVREKDGLALSSRNAYLTPDERRVAPGIRNALVAAAERATPATIIRDATRRISALPGARIDYLELVDAQTLSPLNRLDRPATLATAVFLGKTRLIDNLQIPARA